MSVHLFCPGLGFLLILLAMPHASHTATVFKFRNSDSNGTKAFSIQDANDAQNCCRALHGASPLELDSQISDVSQAWAEHLADIGHLEHSSGQYGENLFAGGGDIVNDGAVPIYYWYQESNGYNYGQNSMGSAGHFTQMVWKSSKKSGFGVASSPTWTYVVANYYPPGNGGDYASNVSPPSGQNNCFDNLDIQALDLALDSIQIL